jgi:hypothetical protein
MKLQSLGIITIHNLRRRRLAGWQVLAGGQFGQ